RIEIVQRAAEVDVALQGRLADALAAIDSRGQTALYEGWLSGCRAIAGELEPAREARIARCFLLTDGHANLGPSEPRAVAEDAAGIWANAGISTSTFGIGDGFNEALLGMMAVAGGGQFHYLDVNREIESTFSGELDSLFRVVARQVRLEIEVRPGMSVQRVSDYWLAPVGNDQRRWSAAVGDLEDSEQRRLVVRFGFPPLAAGELHTVRARLVWYGD